MILIALGANLPSPRWGAPAETLVAAIAALEAEGIRVTARSAFYESAPVPASDQPWFVNAVIAVETELGPERLLEALLALETRFGRRRAAAGEARVLDLDLLAYGDIVTPADSHPALPHPRMHQRAFVLLPLKEIAREWRHPGLGKPVEELIAALPAGQTARPLGAARRGARSP
jgi:2-amino-4-hydroxy-6-hydroxymethyldihydropteridine diphosphokinase